MKCIKLHAVREDQQSSADGDPQLLQSTLYANINKLDTITETSCDTYQISQKLYVQAVQEIISNVENSFSSISEEKLFLQCFGVYICKTLNRQYDAKKGCCVSFITKIHYTEDRVNEACRNLEVLMDN